MKRKALIIGTPGDGVHSKMLPGVDVDLANYRDYLMSPLGGAWTQEEIVVLQSPTATHLKEQLSELRRADYAFVSFSGHGGYNNVTQSTHIELGPNQLFDSRQMLHGAPRQTVILDCCRERYTPALVKSLVERASIESYAEGLDRKKCREMFDRHLEKCLPAVIVLNACDINETAGDDPTLGGIYSSSIIKSAAEFSKEIRRTNRSNGAILDVPDAHGRAATKVRNEHGGRQNPTISQPRVSTYFPFAVVA